MEYQGSQTEQRSSSITPDLLEMEREYERLVTGSRGQELVSSEDVTREVDCGDDDDDDNGSNVTIPYASIEKKTNEDVFDTPPKSFSTPPDRLVKRVEDQARENKLAEDIEIIDLQTRLHEKKLARTKKLFDSAREENKIEEVIRKQILESERRIEDHFVKVYSDLIDVKVYMKSILNEMDRFQKKQIESTINIIQEIKKKIRQTGIDSFSFALCNNILDSYHNGKYLMYDKIILYVYIYMFVVILNNHV